MSVERVANRRREARREREASRKSALIDKEIDEDSRRHRRECTILLLGEHKAREDVVVFIYLLTVDRIRRER